MFAKKIISRLFSSHSLCAAVGLVLSFTGIAGRVDAITVTWSSPAAITSNSVIVNPGNIIDARDFGPNPSGGTNNVAVGADTVVFNYVGLAPFNSGGNSPAYFDNDGTEQPAVGSDFRTVLRSIAYSENTANETISFTGLTPGATYYFQAFSSEDRDPNATAYVTRLAITGSANTVDLTSGIQPGGGEFSTATILLGGAENSFDVVVSGVGSDATQIMILSAVVLSQEELAAVPEPSTFVLAALGVAGLGLLAWKRRKRSV